MKNTNKKGSANGISLYEKEITDFLKNLPGSDNISGVGFTKGPEPANDNTECIDNLEIGVSIPNVKAEHDESISIAAYEMERSELNFSEEKISKRGFLQDDLMEFPLLD